MGEDTSRSDIPGPCRIAYPEKPDPEEVKRFKKMLIEDTLDFHAFDWYHNLFTMGAFAQFSPGQFSTLYADILLPTGCYGNFHFAGELDSHHHAWVAVISTRARVLEDLIYYR